MEWFVDKGYGFIKPDHRGSDNVFLHVSQISHKNRAARGSVVTFQSTFDSVKRSDVAFNVHVVVDAFDGKTSSFAADSNVYPPTQYGDKRHYSPSPPPRSTHRHGERHGVCIFECYAGRVQR